MSKYPVDGEIKISVKCEIPERFELKLRKPEWCDSACLSGAEYVENDGYYIVNRVWKDNEMVLNLPMRLKKEKLNEKTAFIYGPIVLALDEGKGNKRIDEKIVFGGKGKVEKPDACELIRYTSKRDNGENLVFTDYASCGKHWENSHNKISVWLNVK